MGIVFCFNRPSFIYHVPLSGDAAAPPPAATNLTPSLLSSGAPIFAPDGRSLVFLSHDAAAASGVHHATVALCTMSWQGGGAAGEPKVMVDVVRRPAAADSFPGLYGTGFVDSAFISATTLLITSQWRSKSVILAVDTATGKVWSLNSTAAEEGSWTLQSVSNSVIAATLSTPGGPPQLMLAHASGVKLDQGEKNSILILTYYMTMHTCIVSVHVSM